MTKDELSLGDLLAYSSATTNSKEQGVKLTLKEMLEIAGRITNWATLGDDYGDWMSARAHRCLLKQGYHSCFRKGLEPISIHGVLDEGPFGYEVEMWNDPDNEGYHNIIVEPYIGFDLCLGYEYSRDRRLKDRYRRSVEIAKNQELHPKYMFRLDFMDKQRREMIERIRKE